MDLGEGWGGVEWGVGVGLRTRRTVFAAEETDIYSIIRHLLTPGRLCAPLAAERSHEYPSSVLLPEPDGDSTRFLDVSQDDGKRPPKRPTA